MTGTSKKRIVFVRCVLWFGIVADFINAMQYCFPDFWAPALGVHPDQISPFTRFILVHAAALMAAWTLLLLWADRKPVERRMVSLLTVPIALGIGGSMLYLIAEGLISGASSAIIAGPIITAGLFLAAYFAASSALRKA